MIKEHRRTFKLLRMTLDLCLVVAVYALLYRGVVAGINPLGFALEAHSDYALRLPAFLAACWVFAFIASGVYEQSTRAIGGRAALGVAFRLLLTMLLAFALGAFAFKVQFISRKFLFSYSAICFGVLGISKWLEFRLLKAMRRLGFNTRSVLLVGEGPQLQEAWEIFSHNPEWGYRIAGALGLKHSLAKTAKGLRSLGKVGDLKEILRTRIVDEVVFAATGKRDEQLGEVLETAGLAGVPVRVLLNEVFGQSGVQVETLGGKATLVTAPDQRDPYLRLIKRGLDFGLALLAVIVLSPLLALISLAIVVTMGRPIFFVQKRAGLNGRVFFIYKFRTMILNARQTQAQLTQGNEMSGPVFKIKQDPRITPLGRFLRKFTLDELPQFFNVLRGELSIVGPRPLANYEARKVPHWARRRYSVQPGLTCYWQVMGRNKLSFEEWMRLDLRYIDEWSLWTDFKLMLMTVPAVFFSRGAY